MKSHNTLHNTRVLHPTKSNQRHAPPKFTQKNVELSQTPLFFPEGFEKLFLAIYFVTLPYIAGLLFLFFYVSKRNLELFLSLYKDSAFILTWAVGYEMIASLVLLWIFKMGIVFVKESRQPSLNNKFRIP